MPFIGQLTGKQYDTFEHMLYEERKEAMRRAKPDEIEREFADVPPEKLKAICTAAQMETEGRFEDRARSNADVTIWLNQHPEYVNNDFNKKLMEHQMGVKNPNFQELEVAYQQLRGSNLLQLDQAELVKQEAKSGKERAKQIRMTPYTEEELEAMPLDQLRSVCNGAMGR
jgi:hypothetical protein